MERLTELEMSSIGLAILCNFPRFCGEERAKEASDMFRTMRIKIMAYRALGNVEELSVLVKERDEGLIQPMTCTGCLHDRADSLAEHKAHCMRCIRNRYPEDHYTRAEAESAQREEGQDG